MEIHASTSPLLAGEQDVVRQEKIRREDRKTLRRATLATVRTVTPGLPDDVAVATNLSADGAFIRSDSQPPEGSKCTLRLQLPIDENPISLKARVVRSSEVGFGVRFEEVSARDRSRLRAYSGYYETDDAIVRIQQSLGDLIPGNFLPFSDKTEVISILREACDRGVEVLAVPAGRGFRPTTCRILEVSDGRTDELLGKIVFRLGENPVPMPKKVRALYLTFALPPLHYMCEVIVSQHEPTFELLLPDRMYITERRSESRAPSEEAWLELPAPHLGREVVRLPVIDVAPGGVSVRVAPSAMWLVGTTLPSISLVTSGEARAVAGATVQYLRRTDDGWLRAGLRLERLDGGRGDLKARKRRNSSKSLGLLRALSFFGGKVANLVRPTNGKGGTKVEVVRYKNRRNDTVAAIVEATFDTSDRSVRPDVAIVIAPAILKRKEVFGLLSRTILDNLKKEGLDGVVLRFDASHMVGESTMDPLRVAEGRPYYDWTFGHLKDDMAASLRYVDRRFRPCKRALVSVSLSAIPARKLAVEPDNPPIDLWVSPFGCPDAQDMVRNYLAGLDLFPAYASGEAPEAVMIHGRQIRSEALYGQALADGMAYLEDARKDLGAFKAPVCWILGRHDHWVTHSRVRAMLESPGGGSREIFEVPTGHVLKGGDEAIELFKLVSETALKHLFGIDRPAVGPDMSLFASQSQSEWSRVRRARLGDSKEFWREHLFGGPSNDEGYDIMLDHPEYSKFLKRQIELLEPRPGEDVADFGCGTGNLSLEILRACVPEGPNSLTYVDLVPDAIARTAQKISAYYAARDDSPVASRGIVMDLEVPRLAPIADFLQGRLWSVEELVGRVEGLERASALRIQREYGKRLHAILRGHKSTAKEVERLAPGLTTQGVDAVMDIGIAARFLQGRSVPEDLKENVGQPATAEELKFRRLSFGRSGRKAKYEISSESFDKIGASLLLPYLYDPLAFLSEILRILRPGGVLVASSIVPNFDPSKTYQEAAEIIRNSAGPAEERKLAALRHHGNMVSRLIELEEDGRFHFLGPEDLCTLAKEAGFSSVRAFPAFGSPPTAVIIRALK